MPRSVDEILRDAGATVEGLLSGAEELVISQSTPFRVVVEMIAILVADDPAERAALVQHMTERRG